jgi:hypothetical protein
MLTVVVAVALSLPGLGSVEAEPTVAVFDTTVPFATPGPTATTSVNTAELTAKDAFEQLTVPPAPTAGVVQLQPPGEDRETNVVPAGSVSLIVALAAVPGPELIAVIVYVMLLPAITGSGESVFVTDMSADGGLTWCAVPGEAGLAA